MSEPSSPDQTVVRTDPPADPPADETQLRAEPPADPTATVGSAGTRLFPGPGSSAGRVTAGGGASGPLQGFEILGELGRGGMGVVYKARQVRLNRVVALKTILADRAGRAEVARFLAEAEAVAAIRHPHVVQVYEFNGSEDCPYLAMEYLDGGSLSATIRHAGRMESAAAALLVEKIARGIQAAHDHGIVHRDIKPANVLFDETGAPKVTDFGLAKQGSRGDLTDTNAVMGTPAYMSPEQAAGRTKFVGPAADIYALGVVLYECLTGGVPFVGENAVSVVRMVIDEAPEPIRQRVPGVPRDLELICLKCLEKDPRARYPTAAALADDLRRFAAGEPVSVRPPSPGALVRHWARQQFGSAGWTLAGGLACGACAAGSVLTDMFGRKVPEARAKFERLLGEPAAVDRVPDAVLAASEGVTFLLIPALLFVTAALVRPKNRAADLAAGVLTGLVAAVAFFIFAYAWWATYSVVVRPAVDDMAALADPAADALAARPAVADRPPGERRAALAAKMHNDLLLRLPWAIISGMILAVSLTVPIAVALVGAAGGLLRARGLRPVVAPLYLEVAVPVVVFAVHAFFLLNRALWYGMWPQYPAAYAGLLGLCGLAIWLALRDGPGWARAAAQLGWIGYLVVTKAQVLYEYD